jgi:hypothetical protein
MYKALQSVHVEIYLMGIIIIPPFLITVPIVNIMVHLNTTQKTLKVGNGVVQIVAVIIVLQMEKKR